MSWASNLAKAGQDFVRLTMQVAEMAGQISEVLEKLDKLERRQIELGKDVDALTQSFKVHRNTIAELTDAKIDGLRAQVEAASAMAVLKATREIHSDIAKLKGAVAGVEASRRLGSNGQSEVEPGAI